MPGTNLVAVSDALQPAGRRPGRARSTIKTHLVAGLAVSGWLGFLLLAGLLVVGGTRPEVAAGSAPARLAQSVDAPSLLVAPVIVAGPWVPTPLPIQLDTMPALVGTGWIRITGVPALALSPPP